MTTFLSGGEGVLQASLQPNATVSEFIVSSRASPGVEPHAVPRATRAGHHTKDITLECLCPA